MKDRKNVEAVDEGEIYHKTICQLHEGNGLNAVPFGYSCNQFVGLGMRHCLCNESYFFTFYVSENVDF